MADDNRRSRILLEYRQINEDSMKRVEELIWLNTEADCWLLHDSATWNGMVHVKAKKG